MASTGVFADIGEGTQAVTPDVHLQENEAPGSLSSEFWGPGLCVPSWRKCGWYIGADLSSSSRGGRGWGRVGVGAASNQITSSAGNLPAKEFPLLTFQSLSALRCATGNGELMEEHGL